MRTIQPAPFNVYSIDELTDAKAKKNAVGNVIDFFTGDYFLLDDVVENAKETLDKMGFAIVSIYYDCSYSQGSGACFTAEGVDFNKFIPAIKRYFTKEEWKALRKIHSSGMDMILTLNHRGHYYHKNSVCVSLDVRDYNIQKFIKETHVTEFQMKIEESITNWYKDFCKNLYRKLCSEIEYFWKEENCIKAANENGMEFTENGEIYND